MVKLNFHYDELLDELIVESIRYSGQLFRDMAILPIGLRCPFDLESIITNRQDGTVTMKKEK